MGLNTLEGDKRKLCMCQCLICRLDDSREKPVVTDRPKMGSDTCNAIDSRKWVWGEEDILCRGSIRDRRGGSQHRDTGKPTTITREGQPQLKGLESHINMSLKHQITSLPNNGFTGEVRERGKHWHSLVICGDVDEVLWFPAVFENIVLWKTDRFLPPSHSHTFSLSLSPPNSDSDT